MKQEFTNQISARFNDYKVLSGRYVWTSLNFTSTNDAISTSQVINNGITTTQYVNVNGDYSGSFYFGGGFKLNSIGYLGGQMNTSVNHVNNFINGTANTSNNNTYSIGPYLNFEKDEKFEFNINPGITYNSNVATLNQFSTNYYVFSTDFSGNVTLPKKFEIGSSVDVMIRQQTAVFNTNNNVVKWNAYVAKKFLKKGQLEVRVSVFDILNENIGFSRTAQNGIITENSYNTIRRYGMLNVIWNFTKSPSGAAPSASNE